MTYERIQRMSSDISSSPTCRERSAAASKSSGDRQPRRRKIAYSCMSPPFFGFAEGQLRQSAPVGQGARPGRRDTNGQGLGERHQRIQARAVWRFSGAAEDRDVAGTSRPPTRQVPKPSPAKGTHHGFRQQLPVEVMFGIGHGEADRPDPQIVDDDQPSWSQEPIGEAEIEEDGLEAVVPIDQGEVEAATLDDDAGEDELRLTPDQFH